MPYKSETIKLSREQDRRIKLTDEQRQEIREKYASGHYSQRTLAKEYNVSRRTIQFTVDAEKYARAREQFKQRRKDGRYKPSKEEWAEIVRDHRRYKQRLYINGELDDLDTIKKSEKSDTIKKESEKTEPIKKANPRQNRGKK